MKCKRALISLVLIAFLLAMCPGARAIIGDCDGDGQFSVADLVYLSSYVAGDAPANPNVYNCDCDGFPGVNYADYLQLIVGPLLSPPHSDYPMLSDVRFYFNTQIAPDAAEAEVQVLVEVPDDFPVEAFLLPLSFQAEDGQAQAAWTNTDFTGTVADFDAVRSVLYPGGDIISIEANNIEHGGGPVLPAGASGLLCTLQFSSGSGEPNDLRIASLAHSWPMLLKHVTYPGVDGDRIFLPQFIRAPYGDVNSDAAVNLSDAVQIINFVFVGGSPPGYEEP
jgi:hypothetical protein